MVEFYDTSALLVYPDKITSDIWISEISIEELENQSRFGVTEESRKYAREVLSIIRRVEPIVVLLEDAIRWYEGQDQEDKYSLERLDKRDFLSVILTAYYIASICGEEFIFYTESYLSYVNATSLYFGLNTEISMIGEKNDNIISHST